MTAPGDEQPAEPANQPKVEAAVGPTAIPTPAEPPVQAQPQEPAPDDAKATGPADADTRPHAARPSTARVPTRTPSTAPFETRGERPYSPGDHPPPNQTGQRRQ